MKKIIHLITKWRMCYIEIECRWTLTYHESEYYSLLPNKLVFKWFSLRLTSKDTVIKRSEAKEKIFNN